VMAPGEWLVVAPSAHARELAGWSLFEAAEPAVQVLAADETVVVLSRSRTPEREVHLDRCTADGVPVLIRPSGGGAVVLASGTLIANIVARTLGNEARPEREFGRFCGRTAAALAACDVTGVEVRGVSDLCLGERKIAGTALRLWRGLVLFQLSLLVDMDLGLIETYLPLPSRQPDYRQGRHHRDFVTSLRAAGYTASVRELGAALRLAFHQELVS